MRSPFLLACLACIQLVRLASSYALKAAGDEDIPNLPSDALPRPPSVNNGPLLEPAGVRVTPTCAAVLLMGGGVVGAIVATTVPAAVMYIIGLSPEGVIADSFAAAWQSTMPLVAKGSLFALLQSAATGGVGSEVVISGASIGIAAGAMVMEKTCRAIDNVPPFSAEEGLVNILVEVYQQLALLPKGEQQDLQDIKKATIQNATRRKVVNATE